MTISAIREKLYDYIRIADDKKIKAIYSLLEDEITEDIEWWKKNDFIKELDHRYTNWETGKEQAISLAEADMAIEQLKRKRKTK